MPTKLRAPLKWLQEKTGAVGFNPFYEPHAHGVDLPVPIHQGVSPRYLEEGLEGVIKYFVSQVASCWTLLQGLLLVCCDFPELMPVTKAREQSGRTAAAKGSQQSASNAMGEGCTPPFAKSSGAEIPARKYQPNLLANCKEVSANGNRQRGRHGVVARRDVGREKQVERNFGVLRRWGWARFGRKQRGC